MTLTSGKPLVLTLKLDAISFTKFDNLRRRYFPAVLNFVPAHVTLFHALPGEEEQRIAMTLRSLCLQTPVLNLSFDKARFLGRGVAIEVKGPGLSMLRKRLASEWSQWLSAQDQGGYRPHITI